VIIIKMKKGLLTMGLTLILGLLPIIPILRAAVIPDPVYRRVWVSFWQIARYMFYPMPGLQYRFTGYSWGVIILIFGIGISGYYLFSKKVA
jgi:hypothetical protein